MHRPLRLALTLIIAIVFTTIAPLRPHASRAGAIKPADLVLLKGTIVKVDDVKPQAEAIAVGSDTIVAVGSNAEIKPYVGAQTKVIDLKDALWRI